MSAEKSPKVADFSTHFSGPVASRQLVQLGADIIKIEHPRFGDGNRTLEPLVDGVGSSHLYLNAGTRSLAVDPRSEEWPTVVAAVTRWADVVIVGNRPSNSARLGLDFASLLEHNRSLVYCAITGYGLDGPWAGLSAHGLNMDALAGAVPVAWENGQPGAINDYRSIGTTLAGIEAALGILAALHHRDRGLGAQFVHVSIWETAMSWLWRDLTTYANTGKPWHQYKDLGSRYAMYQTADEGILLVCPIERRYWEAFCDITGLPDSLRERGDWDGGTDFGESYVDERAAIQKSIATKPRDEWLELLAAGDVPSAPVLHWSEAMASEHAVQNGAMARYKLDGRPIEIPTTPVSITAVPDGPVPDPETLARCHAAKGDALTPPPALGQDAATILRDLGIAELTDRLAR